MQDEGGVRRETPILLTTFVLQIPNIVTAPPIEELQYYFGQLIVSILENHKHIIMWGQRYTPSKRLSAGGDKLQCLLFMIVLTVTVL